MNKLLYKTVLQHQEFELPKIKWSRFIGNIFHVENKEESEWYIHDIETKYPDASHHCFAYRYDVQMNFNIFWDVIFWCKYNKSSDAGEPANTAGKPIMNMIEKYELHNILIVVTRYFGGTLLGVGGLIQAYREAAKQVIEHADIIQIEIMKTLKFSYPFDLVPIVMNVINKYDAKIVQEKYDKNVECEIRINSWYVEVFKKDLFENSQGKIETQ